MDKDKINVVLSPGLEKAELIIREVSTVNELEIMRPVKIGIVGVPGTIRNFLDKRSHILNEEECHVLVNRDENKITLVINESDFYTSGSVVDKLEFHPKLIEFGINMGKEWDPLELGQFFKMNRTFFLDRTENMNIVSTLRDFKAKVDVSIEKMKSESGSFADNYAGAVTSNLPGVFKLSIPIFKGLGRETLEVEFWATVNGRDVTLQLVSPGAVAFMEEERDKILDFEKERIIEVASDTAIMEI